MSRKVLAFGEVMMRMATPSHLPLPQTNTLHVAYTGTGLNVLSALSHFGLRTSLVTKLPDNPLGDAAIANIRADRKSTRLNSSHVAISYAVFCLKKKKTT